MRELRLGVVGCGAICGIYFQNFAKFGLGVAAVADLDPGRAQAAAEAIARREQRFPRALSTEALLHDPEVDVVVNLTVPKAHFPISRQALQNGKHIYSEKPLAVEREEGRALVAMAQERGLRIGCAPDTVLGAGMQTCRRLVDEGEIGEPVGAHAFMLCPGHEGWHPSPEFYYEAGGGPMFDMGPYYVCALVTLLGGIRSVQAQARASFPTRTIGSEPKRGTVVPVETPTYVTGVLEFECGALATVTTSFDVQRTTLPCIEVYGSEGTLVVPDPNNFSGPIRLFRKGSDTWRDVPLAFPHAENSRGLGVLDLVDAVEEGRPNRASGQMALHVLDAMHAFLESSAEGRAISLDAFPGRDEPMPA
jgi:predicted dehydrogenase